MAIKENKIIHTDSFYMQHALHLANLASEAGEVPVGALIVNSTGDIISEGYNLRESAKSAIAHAELIAIEKACQKLARWRLHDCTLFVTLEPCFMCAGAVVLARIPKVIFATPDTKAGAAGSLANILCDTRLNHRCEVVSGLCAEESSLLLKKFFKKKRECTSGS